MFFSYRLLMLAWIATLTSAVTSGWASAGETLVQAPLEPAFEVASVKPSRIGNMVVTWNGRTFVMTSATVEKMILLAYELLPSHVIGGPDWMKEERFEIRAKAPRADLPRPMNAAQQRERLVPMLRTLLAERFALRIREETRVLPVYVLLPKQKEGGTPRGMRPPDSACEEIRAADLQGVGPPAADSPIQSPCRIWFRSSSAGLMTMSARSTSMREFTGVMRGLLLRNIVDESGIEGNFALSLTLGLDQIPAWASLSVEPTQWAGGPSVAAALADDLNLSLRSERRPVPVLVVEHLEHPTPN